MVRPGAEPIDEKIEPSVRFRVEDCANVSLELAGNLNGNEPEHLLTLDLCSSGCSGIHMDRHDRVVDCIADIHMEEAVGPSGEQLDLW